jgi:hypothetical protein
MTRFLTITGLAVLMLAASVGAGVLTVYLIRDYNPGYEFLFKRVPTLLEKGAPVATGDIFTLSYLGVILLVGFAYVALLYFKDGRGVGPWWGTFLGTLRTAVFAVLGFVFLLPALQKNDTTIIRSKGVLLFDTSTSMIDTRDEVPEGDKDPSKLPTRQDKVLELLKTEAAFRLTDRSIASLKDKGVPDGVRKKLDEIRQTDDPKEKNKKKDVEFDSRETFAHELAKALSKDEMAQFQEVILDHVKQGDGPFLRKLTDNNKITVYRFGSALDEGFLQLDGGRFFSKDEWEEYARHPEKRKDLPAPGAMPNEFWSAFLKPTGHMIPPEDWTDQRTKHLLSQRPRDPMKPNVDWTDGDKTRFTELAVYNARAFDRAIFDGTNVYQSLADTLAREKNNLTRGIVLVSDGRSHLGSPELIDEIRRRAKEKEIPIFVIGVGSVRQEARWEVVDLRHPKQIQPDDPFRLVAEVKGDNLPGESFPIKLEITKVKITPEEKGPDGKVITPKKETKLPMSVVEQRPPKKKIEGETPKESDKEPPLEEVVIGDSIIITPVDETAFDTGPRPRAAVEFPLEPGIIIRAAAKLGPEDLRKVLPSVAAGKDEKVLQALIERDVTLSLAALAAKGKGEVAALEALSKFAKIKKWGLGETKQDEEYRFKVYIPDKHKLDRTEGRAHLERTGGMRVLKKPLSVLVFTSSTSKDYEFLRELLIRETQKDLARVTVVLQPVNRDDTSHPPGTVQGLPEKRFRAEFPSLYRPDVPITEPESEEAINDLASYDVIVALDPDWTRIRDVTGQNIARWVENGGGLVVVGSTRYTKRLSRPGDYKAKLQPIIDVLPVVLKDVDALEFDRKPDQPWNLKFESGAGADMEFLNLGDESAKGGLFEDLWEKHVFPRGGDSESGYRTGFYSFYPVKKVIPGSRILARFGDPKAKTDDGDPMPYLVVSDPSSPKRVVWIGSSETWRLRQGKEAYHERFWTKLLRYAGARTQGKINKQLTMELGGPYKTDQFIQVDAKAQGPDGKAYTGDWLNLVIKPRGVGLAIEKQLRKRSGTDIYSDQFRLDKPGTYDVELTVPDRPGLTENGTLDVRESNPEKDDTRPDFETLYKLASDAEDVKLRMKSGDYEGLLRALSRPKTAGEAEKPKGTEKEKPRLFFNLDNAGLIPDCIDKDETVQTSRGKPEDLWDTGWWPASDGKPILSKVLIVVVGLLSLEWLIRKLLRLA